MQANITAKSPKSEKGLTCVDGKLRHLLILFMETISLERPIPSDIYAYADNFFTQISQNTVDVGSNILVDDPLEPESRIRGKVVAVKNITSTKSFDILFDDGSTKTNIPCQLVLKDVNKADLTIHLHKKPAHFLEEISQPIAGLKAMMTGFVVNVATLKKSPNDIHDYAANYFRTLREKHDHRLKQDNRWRTRDQFKCFPHRKLVKIQERILGIQH